MSHHARCRVRPKTKARLRGADEARPRWEETMGKKKVTRTAVSRQPTEEEKGKELFLAQHLVARRYWDDKKATINDALEELCHDLYTTKNILEGISLSIYETNIEGSGCLDEKTKTTVLLGIHHTLGLLVTFLDEVLERSADVYTDHLPARKKEGQPEP